MKKMILILAVAVSTLSAFAGEETVNSKVLNSFKAEFNAAKDVVWTTGANFYTASFIYNNKYINAFYDTEGGLIGITRYLSLLDLPMNLQITIKNNYGSYWVSDLFEVSKHESTSYYITLENADTKVVLKSYGGSDWSSFKKVKKI
jgi:hypothetical protein